MASLTCSLFDIHDKLILVTKANTGTDNLFLYMQDALEARKPFLACEAVARLQLSQGKSKLMAQAVRTEEGAWELSVSHLSDLDITRTYLPVRTQPSREVMEYS